MFADDDAFTTDWELEIARKKVTVSSSYHCLYSDSSVFPETLDEERRIASKG